MQVRQARESSPSAKLRKRVTEAEERSELQTEALDFLMQKLMFKHGFQPLEESLKELQATEGVLDEEMMQLLSRWNAETQKLNHRMRLLVAANKAVIDFQI